MSKHTPGRGVKKLFDTSEEIKTYVLISYSVCRKAKITGEIEYEVED
jgi:hypothetical protein